MEEAARSFGERVAALGSAPPTLKPLKAPARGAVIIKAASRDPCLVALASAASRVTKGVWTGEAWEQRMPLMRRFGDFTKEHGLEMSGEHVPLFIVSLKLAESSAAWCERTLLSLTVPGSAPIQVFLSALRRAAAENPTRRTRTEQRAARRSRAGMPLRWEGLLQKWRLRSGSQRAWYAYALEKILQPCAAKAYSIKRGALVHVTAAVVEHDVPPRIATQLGKRAGPPELPRSVWNAGPPSRTPRSLRPSCRRRAGHGQVALAASKGRGRR
ncbi:hypothetical protein ERJ75_001344100 [Trypanosoma vivax]|uniref:Uncharacterized protein n=1 Tax=Trypanosoma vivax (strain Y486) TaxID=1055687 RepID=G0UD11_TRYVY|nr:hypothetical protein ERJ75_001344100 [Trypanosoma vivax]CCC53721.1 hypothetical protein, conserved in T. vivax [Trypanosoma vivax Y486]